MFKTLSTIFKVTRNAASNPALSFLRNASTKSLFIKNIPTVVRKTELHAIVAPFGPVFDIYYPVDDDGYHKGFAFITIKSEKVEAAVAKLNGLPCEDRVLLVKEALPKKFADTPTKKNFEPAKVNAETPFIEEDNSEIAAEPEVLECEDAEPAKGTL